MTIRGTTPRKASRVLLINSNAEIIHILEVNLTHADFKVSSAYDGAEALSKIKNDHPDIIILDQELFDIDGNEIYQDIIELSQASHTPIILIGDQPRRNNEIAKTEATAIYYITKPFDPREIVTLVQGFLIHKERIANTNQLTGLMNHEQIEKEISRLIRQEKPFAAIYLETHDFKAIKKAYGSVQSNRLLRLLTDIVTEAVRLFGNSEDLAGYCGGDRFVIISTQRQARTLCRRIITDFNRRIKELYHDEHTIVDYGTRGGNVFLNERNAPNTSIHVALVNNQKYTYQHISEVTKAAAKQIEHLKRFPESNCFLDLKANDTDLSLGLTNREMTNNEDLIAMRGVLAWLDFLAIELDISITSVKDCINTLESVQDKDMSQLQLNSLRKLQKSVIHLNRIAEGIINLPRDRVPGVGAFLCEVDIENLIRWVLKQVQGLLEQKKIKTNLEIIGETGQIIGDKRPLTHSLLNVIQNEILFSESGGHLHICLEEKSEEYISIKITNPQHHIATKALNSFLQDPPDSSQHEIQKKGIYPAKIMMLSLGGNLEITCDEEKVITYTFTIPKKWQS